MPIRRQARQRSGGCADRLIRFIARAPVIVFNAPFNQGTLERAFEHNLGSQPELEWIDLMVLMPSLYPERIAGQARMDAWLGAFGIDRMDHQDALLEALCVAQLLQVALARAMRSGPRYPAGAARHPEQPQMAARGSRRHGVNDNQRRIHSRALFNPPG
jgi:DNA polymerase III epsilon subunit-like protein